MDSKLIKHKAFPKPSLLKDYLLEEMNSCSSNGFKSFPRRQCCTTTVRFLIDIDLSLNLNQHKKYFIFNKTPPLLLRRNPSKSTASAFQRIIAAVKRLPFAAWGSPAKNGLKKSIFGRRKSSHNKIQRWKSLDQLLTEDSRPLDIPSSDNSSEVNLNLTDVKRKGDDDDDMVEVLKNGDVSGDSTTGSSATKSSLEEKQWTVISEGKEQFSPVSVLDCRPFDDFEEVSFPFHFQHMEGSREKVKVMEKIAEVEPLNLSKRFSLEEQEQEKDALDLPYQLMDTLPSSYDFKITTDKLLLDFFREEISMHSSFPRQWTSDHLIEEAERWINGTKFCDDASFLGWNRQPYVKDKEEWKSLDQEIGEIVLELETGVFHALFDDLLVDISSTHKL